MRGRRGCAPQGLPKSSGSGSAEDPKNQHHESITYGRPLSRVFGRLRPTAVDGGMAISRLLSAASTLGKRYAVNRE